MNTPTVRMSTDLLSQCETEVTNKFPRESGGVLMGCRKGQDLWQVDHVIGPGPNAVHGRVRFIPDLEWQHEQIAKRFFETNGQSTYLGDWHSHPSASHGRLSFKDKRAIKAIIQAPEAACDAPLMMILWAGTPGWRVSPWVGDLKDWFGLRQLRVRLCRLQLGLAVSA